MTAGPVHLTESGEPCAAHPPAKLEVLLQLALIGARVQGFNHDLASKLQGLMMALEELGETLAERGDAELIRAVTDAIGAAQEAADLLTANRQLTRVMPAAVVTLRELLGRAGERAGVTLTGPIAEVEVEVPVPSLIQAIALVLDVAGGPGRGRTLPATYRRVGTRVELALPLVVPATPLASEYLALAQAALAKAGAELACSGDRIAIRLPAATGPAVR